MSRPQALASLLPQVELPLRARFSDAYEKAPQQLAEAKQMLADLEGSGADAPALAAAFQRIVRLQLRAGRMNWYRGMRAISVDSFAIRLGDTAVVGIAG